VSEPAVAIADRPALAAHGSGADHDVMPTGPLTAVAVAAPFGRDVAAGLALMADLLADARRRGAGLVVFPEGTLGGYVREPAGDETGVDLPPSLEVGGPEVAQVVRMAGDVTVCFGLTVDEDDGRHNVALCVSGDGVLGRHDKVHLPPAERFAYVPGDRFAAFDTPVGRIGMVVCYDKLFPEASRALALDGADVVASLAAWPVDRRTPARQAEADRQTRHFDVVDQARAIENQITWVSANQTGPWGALRFLGSAKVVDPDGVVRARTGADAGLAVADVEPAADRSEVLLDVDHLADRRPQSYAAGVQHDTPAVLSLVEAPAGG
jgi:predicted amidohydrolase